MSSDLVQVLMAAGVAVSLLLHYVAAKRHSKVAEKAAEALDAVEALAKDAGVPKAA